eukprot:TRINITY_DN3112_c0_g3_i1.p3 TRINITY_DN3112_c0_g3~~TRINITY_DN3112_c0_g3_i1.p3  ORF type:complete len:102 (-),score=4.63 TRINITY_DN3112_c0_g3_i1:417-722(-)
MEKTGEVVLQPSSPNAPDLLRIVRRQPPGDPPTQPSAKPERPCAFTLGQRMAGSTAAARAAQVGASSSLRERNKKPSASHLNPDSDFARRAVANLPDKSGE